MWSSDGGQTWTPWARGPFPMWACTEIVRTASGALLIGGRYPGLAVRVSFDDGMTWKCYQIDNVGWANGTMIEVEPDVVLFFYGALDSEKQTRCQRVREGGLEPG